MQRLKLTIAYEGGAFLGWQSQPHQNAVQDHLRQAFEKILESQVKLTGAGRTDAGVHALAQIAHVDVPRGRFQSSTWINALNSNLPPAVRILACRIVPPTFHAQHSAKGKIYRYRIWNAPVLHPLELGRAWHVPKKISLDHLNLAAQSLTGTHDFASFAANRGRGKENTIRTLYSVRVIGKEPAINIEFKGNGFLYRMVRMLTGSLIHVALGRAELPWLTGLLNHPGRTKTNHTAPPEGLYLKKVIY